MVFVGYCGWMSGQLNAEVAANGWTVAAASAANTLALVNASARAGDAYAAPRHEFMSSVGQQSSGSFVWFT